MKMTKKGFKGKKTKIFLVTSGKRVRFKITAKSLKEAKEKSKKNIFLFEPERATFRELKN